MATHSYDLVIVGAGSGNTLPLHEFAGWRIALVEADRFGGTCLNRGCIPSKMYVHAADTAAAVRDAGRFGIRAQWQGADWSAIRDRIFKHIDPLPDLAMRYREAEGIDVYVGAAEFVSPKVLRVGGDELRGEHVVLSTGSRPKIPEIPGLTDVPYVTSDTVMRLSELPASMVILGGGYVSAEMAHVFGALGTEITIVQRSDRLLERNDRDVADRFTDLYAQRYDVRLNAEPVQVSKGADGHGVRLELKSDTGPQEVEGDVLLVATGRRPNSDKLGMVAGGLETDAHGHIRTDKTLQTDVPGVWALGDLANHFQLKHMANAEARIVWHNLLHPESPRRAQFPVVPAAVFSDPQVASAGATEEDLRQTGQPYLSARRAYGDAAFGWALEDTTSFVKVLADPATRLLLGAHIIGPDASLLIQPLVQAMCLGNTADEVARGVLYTHPALTEVVEQALLKL